MRILAIDYGRKKIGLATGDTDSKLSEPLVVIRFENEEEAITKVGQIAQLQQTKRIVLGISEGRMARETKEFGKRLEKKLGTSVVYQDETLTTHDAQILSIGAGIKRIKRKKLEDAYSAALILQKYFEKVA